MTHRNYIVIKGGGGEVVTEPDPSVYCPLNGYIPDPTLYVEPEVITNMPEPGDDELQFLVTDQGSAHILMNYVGVTNSGKYVATVYGNSDQVIYTVTKTGQFSYNFPIGQGKPSSGYTVFRLVFKSELAANKIHSFGFTSEVPYGDASWRVIAAKIKAPGLTTIASTFLGHAYIRDIEFVGPHDLITNASSFCSGCAELRSVKMGSSLAELTSLQYAFLNTTKLSYLELPDRLPKVTNMMSMLYQSGIPSFSAPTDMPLLNSMSGITQNCPRLTSLRITGNYPELYSLGGAAYNCTNLTEFVLTATAPKLNDISSMLNGCSSLAGEIVFQAMPNIVKMNSLFWACKKITKITFNGTMDLLQDMAQMAYMCYELTEVVLPRSMKALNNTNATLSALDMCYKLKRIVYPDAIEFNTTATILIYYLTYFSSDYLLEELTTCADWGTKFYAFYLGNPSLLTQYVQPTQKVVNCAIGPSSGPYPPAGTYFPFRRMDVDFSQAFGTTTTPSYWFYYCNISITEQQRILNALPERPASVTSYPQIGFSGCLCQTSYNVSVFYGWINDNYLVWRFSYGQSLAGVQVGMSIYDNDVRFTNRAATISGGVVNKAGHHMPNGTEVSFRVLDAGISGLVVYHKYYVVGATNDTFQVSETENGSPVAIGGSGAIQYCAFPKVEEVGANYIRVTFEMENPSSLTNIIAWMSFYKKDIGAHKGWYVY